MVYAHSSYRTYLKSVLADRIQRNPAYSLRAMAGHLGCSHSLFSEVLRGKANFSQTSMRRISSTLQLSSEETEYLCLLNQLEVSADPETRASLQRRLRAIHPNQEVIQNLDVDLFKQVADWHHAAIYALFGVERFRFTPQNVARRLGISLLDTEVALERMLRLGLVLRDKRGCYKRSAQFLRAESPVKNEALRSAYRQMLEKTRGALEQQGPEGRLSGFETLAFARDDLPKAQAILRECFSKVIALSTEAPERDDVYHLTIHFFSLSQRRRHEN